MFGRAKKIIKSLAELAEIEGKERAERELEARGMLQGAPSRCGLCRFNRWSDKHKFFHCAHKGGPDRFGNIAFADEASEPPDWCPRKNGVWQPMIAVPRGWLTVSQGNDTQRAREAARGGGEP